MQWESGRTGHTLLHAARKAKADQIMRSSSVFPTLDNLRNFLLTPTADMVSFFQHLAEAL
jgi:hypothetical protein